MNEFDEMKAREPVMRDPEFSLRILWIRQVLLFVFLGVGVVMTGALAVRALSGDGHAGHILFPACWTVLVIMFLRDGMTRIRDIKKEIIAQQQLGQVSSETAVSDEPSS